MYLKKLFLVLVSFAFVHIANAQDDEKVEENLFNNVSLHSINGMGGILTEFSALNDELAFCSGLMGGVMFNQKIYIGGYGIGMGSLNKLEEPIDSLLKYQKLELGGVIIGYNHQPHKLVHFTASSRMGWGTVGAYDKEEAEKVKYKDKVFSVTPNIGVELNVTKWFKINGVVGYRFLTGIDLDKYYNENSYNGPTTTLTLLFGGFNNL